MVGNIKRRCDYQQEKHWSPQHHFQRWSLCLGWRVWSDWTNTTQHLWTPSEGVIYMCHLWNLGCVFTSIQVFMFCLFSWLCVSVDEMPRRGWKLALRRCGGAREWATLRRPETMLCLDAALPTDTTGNNGAPAETTSWMGRTEGGVSEWQAVWSGVRLRSREGMDGEGEGAVMLCDG